MTQMARQHSDIRVKNTVADELAWTSTVNAAQVGVSVHDGVVTLSGEVDSHPEKTAALAAALRVAGVTSVVDEITVRSRTSHGDAEIATRAKHALDTSTSIPHTVRAAVHNHRVTLVGTVPWNYQRNVARRLMEEIPGVRSVLDDIKVVPQLPFAATTAERNIKAAFVRNAQIDADQVHAVISGSEIELTGTTRTWAERKEAADVAWDTPGVTKVHNNIHVVP